MKIWDSLYRTVTLKSGYLFTVCVQNFKVRCAVWLGQEIFPLPDGEKTKKVVRHFLIESSRLNTFETFEGSL